MDLSPSSALQVRAYSSLHHEEFSYRWTINDANYALMHLIEEFWSPAFTVPRIPNKLFLLAHIYSGYELKLTLKMPENIKPLPLSRYKDISVLASKSSFSVLDSSALDSLAALTETTKDKQFICEGVMQNFTWNINLTGDGLKHFLHNDILTVQFSASLIFLTDPVESIIQNTVLSENNPNKRMKLMFEDELFTDITIKTGEKTFKAHKALLASYSDVFKKMFEIDMKEKREGVVTICDIAPEVMADLLAYMYSGTAPHLKKLAKELLIVADKYNIPCFLLMCENELKLNLTSANVAEILLLLDGIQLETRLMKSLKEACIKFFQNHSSSVYSSSSWKTLKETSPKLAMETVESMTRQDN